MHLMVQQQQLMVLDNRTRGLALSEYKIITDHTPNYDAV